MPQSRAGKVVRASHCQPHRGFPGKLIQPRQVVSILGRTETPQHTGHHSQESSTGITVQGVGHPQVTEAAKGMGL